MEICVDKNNLVVIENLNIPQVKEYTYNVGGYIFSGFDKGIIVWHKKEFKIVNLKNLGDNMGVIYVSGKQQAESGKLDVNSFVGAVCNYKAYDENSGESYYFLPKINKNEIEKLNNYFVKLGVNLKLEKNDKGIIVAESEKQKVESKASKINDSESFISKMFAWILLYGKLDIKNGELMSFRFHLPLFGAYLAQREVLDEQIKTLIKSGIFVKKDVIQANDGIIYQVSGNDYELLQLFASWYQSIEKISKIPKYDQSLEIKDKLIKFIKSDGQIPEEGRDETVKLLKKNMIKILIK